MGMETLVGATSMLFLYFAKTGGVTFVFSLVDAIPLLYSTAPLSPGREISHMFGALVFAVLVRGMPHYHQALEAKGAVFLDSKGQQ